MFSHVLCLMFMMTVCDAIPFEVRADNYRDCRDESYRCDPIKQYKCLCLNLLLGRLIYISDECIRRSWRCDGWKDCKNGADEVDCLCPTDYLQCGCDHGGSCGNVTDEYRCVPPTFVGDGRPDCLNGKDEEICNLNNSNIKLCDGRIDCFNSNIDEANCTNCPSNRNHRCDCNNPGDMKCSRSNNARHTCYSDSVASK